MLTTSCDVIKGAPKQSKICIPAFDRQRAFPGAAPLRAAIAARLFGSFVLLPLVIAQGAATRRRVPRLPPAGPPHHGLVPGAGKPIRLLAIGKSTVCGVGLTSGEEVGRCHNCTGTGAPDRPSGRMARGGAFRRNRQ